VIHVGLHQLLKNGLDAQENPGLKALPLTASVYEFLGQDATQKTLHLARQMFGGTLTSRAFLQHLDPEMVCAIVQNAAAADDTHKAELLALGQSLSIGKIGSADER
jgi:hypothetical protein